MPSANRIVIRVYYDFASSLCYAAHRVMAEVGPALDAAQVALDWMPLDLSRLLGWVRGGRVAEDRVSEIAGIGRELGVPLRVPPLWLDSRPVHAVALSLGDSAREATWRERVWTALQEENRTLEEPGLAEALCRDLAFSPSPDLLATADGRLAALTEEAREAMVTGVPTFMLAGWAFGGIQQADTMRRILTRFAERQRSAA